MDARAYNEHASKTIWNRSSLPWWLRDLEPGSVQFAREVRRYQEQHFEAKHVDGKLGAGTWESILDTEHIRTEDAGEVFGPTHLEGARIVASARVEKKRDPSKVVGVGIHTTGSGIYAGARKLARRGDERPEADLVKTVIRNILGHPSSYVSNAYIFPDGETYLTVPVNERPVHGGLGPYRDMYAKGFDHWSRYRGTNSSDLKPRARDGRYDEWKAIAEAEGFESPVDLCRDPNGMLWAFDFVPEIVDGRERFNDLQIERGAELVLWASGFYGFEICFGNVLEHRLWNPVTRWPWDPGADYSRARLGEALRRLSSDISITLGGGDQ